MKITCTKDNKIIPYDVQGEHIDFAHTGSILKHFRIKHYGSQSKENHQGNMSSDCSIGMDRYKDFIVIYNIDWQSKQDHAIYIIYDKTKPFTPKTILSDIDSIEFPQYLIEELFVNDSQPYRVTKIRPFINSNINWLKLLQTVKSKLRFYPLVEQDKFNEIRFSCLKAKPIPDKIQESINSLPNIFLDYKNIFAIFSIVLDSSNVNAYVEYKNFIPLREWKQPSIWYSLKLNS